MNTQVNTSQEAYEAIKPSLPSLQERVFTVIKDAGENGATNEDIGKALPDVEHYSTTQRPSELLKAGRIKQNGVRLNSRNRNQKVWVVA